MCWIQNAWGLCPGLVNWGLYCPQVHVLYTDLLNTSISSCEAEKHAMWNQSIASYAVLVPRSTTVLQGRPCYCYCGVFTPPCTWPPFRRYGYTYSSAAATTVWEVSGYKYVHTIVWEIFVWKFLCGNIFMVWDNHDNILRTKLYTH